MSMILELRTASDATIQRLMKDPESIFMLIEVDPSAEEASTPTDERMAVDLDKAWHAIHYLLTGSVWGGKWPAAFLLVGGQQLGDVEVGYGPARALSAAQTREAAAALAATPFETLAKRFDGPKLDAQKIYPEIWARDGDEGLEYIQQNYDSLRDFVAAAAAKGMGMLLYIT